jgi:hypothetical protein
MLRDHDHSQYEALLAHLEAHGLAVTANRNRNRAWCAMVKARRLP